MKRLGVMDLSLLEDGEYVVIPRERWVAIQGELMARPELMAHIGRIPTWFMSVNQNKPKPKDEKED